MLNHCLTCILFLKLHHCCVLRIWSTQIDKSHGVFRWRGINWAEFAKWWRWSIHHGPLTATKYAKRILLRSSKQSWESSPPISSSLSQWLPKHSKRHVCSPYPKVSNPQYVPTHHKICIVIKPILPNKFGYHPINCYADFTLSSSDSSMVGIEGHGPTALRIPEGDEGGLMSRIQANSDLISVSVQHESGHQNND